MNSRPYSTTPPGRTTWWRPVLALAFLGLFSLPGDAQVNYSFNFDLNSTGWTGNYARFTGATTCGGVGGSMRQNLWSSSPTNQLISPSTGTSVGGLCTIGYTYKCAVWSANTAAAPTPWGTYVVQYGSTAAGPWTTMATVTNELQTASCIAKSHTFTPPAGALFIRWGGTWSGGDFFMNFDNVTITEVTGPCAGTPAPGNTTGPSSACPTAPFTLGLQNATTGSGVTYQWQRDSGGGYVPFGTSSSTQSVSQTAATTYRALVTCAGNTTSSNPLAVAMNGFISCYCTPTTTNGCLASDHITNVTFGTINNNTGVCLSASYSDYSAISTSVGQTANVPISVSIAAGGTEFGGAWIDYDQSGTFDNTEFITLNGGLGQAGGGAPYLGTAAIPISALLGPTRMRVRSSWNAAIAPNSACATYSYGECEDYTVNITVPPTCVSPAVSNSGVTANSANIAWTCGGCTGTYYVEYGLSGFTPGAGASAGAGGTIWTGGPIVSSPVTITGLASSTAYTVYVRQNCGGQFSSNTPSSFATTLDCASAPSLTCGTPETFTIPSGTGQFFFGSPFCSPPGNGTGPYCTPGKEKIWQFVAPNAGTYILNSTAASGTYADFFFKPAPGTCDASGWTYINDVIGVEQANFTIPAPGTYYLIADLEASTVTTQTFSIVCPLPCATPQFPFVQNLTSSSAQIAWTCTGCTGNNFIVEYGAPGFTLGTGLTVTSATSPATITGLATTTSYQAYVRQDCGNVGDGLSNWSSVVNFTTLAAPPPNDDCLNAIPVVCATTYTGSNVAATGDGVPSQASGGEPTVDNGVWYIYTPTVTGEQVTASLCTGTAFDTRIHVFQGSCGSLVGVAGADDNCGLQSTITWNALPGIIYYIAVEGYFTGSGTFNLGITCGPLCTPFVLNDLCANRTVVTMGPNCIPFGGNLSCATNSAGNNPACIGGFAAYPDAYYEFVSTAPDAFVTLTGGAGLRFVLYNNTCTVTPGTEVFCSGVVTSGTPTLVTGLTTSNTYVLRVLQPLANAATFSLCVQKVDVSDDPCTAVPLLCGDQRFGRTVGRLNNIPVGACSFNGAASTGGVNYFSYTALADEDVTFSTCGLSTFDSRISVFEGLCTSLACNMGNDNSPGCPNSSSTVQIRAVTGQTYTIMVHGSGAAEGNYQMIVFCEPYCSGTEANDRCSGASAAAMWTAGDPAAVETTETLVCSYLDGPTSCSGTNAVQGVWYTLTTNANNTDYDVYIAGNSENPVYTTPLISMALFSGSCSTTGAAGQMMCVVSAGGTTQLPPLATSTTYRMLVYNQGGLSEGTFGLLVTHPGFNDGGISAIAVPNGTVCDQRLLPVVTLTNYGEAPLSSAQIISRIDGSIVQTYNWSGPALATGASTTVTLPEITSPSGIHNYTAEVLLANGQVDELAANSGITSSYDATGQTVKVRIFTDSNGSQTSWTLYDPFFFPVGSGGPYTGQNNQQVEASVCLATTFGSCFYFLVFDSAGDGITNGGWSLVDSQNRSVLQDNGQFASQSPSLTPASPIYTAHEFCLPLGPSPIQAAECNVFNNYLNNKVYTTAVAGVTTYQFEFSDPNAGFYRRISLLRNWVKFGEMVSTPLVYGTTYYCRARADQGSNGFADDFYGAGCEMAMSASQPICTELISTPGPTFSCGVTKAFGGSAKIWAQPVTYATQYRFKFEGGLIDPDGPNPNLLTDTVGIDMFNDPAVPGTRNIVRTSYVLPLRWSTYTLVNGQTYNVSVEVFVGGVWTGYCGGVCQVTIANPPGMLMEHGSGTEPTDIGADGISLSLWPNPVSDGRVNLMIGDLVDATQMITVDVYDVFGKRVMTQHYENAGEVFNVVLDLDASMAAGNYMVHITVNDEQYTERLNVVR